LSLALEVFARADDRCEYCHTPQTAFQRTFHLEHITARSHGGATDLDNLALACWLCNFRKGSNLAGIDPQTGEVVVLFHPRKDKWADHFEIQCESSTADIRGKTSQGRATVNTLRMNTESQQLLRAELWREGIFGEKV
jgi:hypothetical protein